MPPQRGRLLRGLLIGAVLGAIAMSLTALYGDASALKQIGLHYPWKLFGFACALACGNYLLRFARWELYLRALSLRIPTASSFVIFIAGFSMSITPAKMGELLKSWLLKRRFGIPASRSAPIVVVERIGDVAALLFLTAVGAHLFPGGALVAPVCLLGILLLLALSQRRVGMALLAWLSRFGWLAKVRARAEPLLRAYWELGAPRIVALGFVLSLAGWALEVGAFLIICSGLDLELKAAQASFIFGGSTLGGAISMLPGGLGPTEVGFTALLQELGASAEGASFCTILTRLATLWLAVALGLLALVVTLRAPSTTASSQDPASHKGESQVASASPPRP